VAVEPRHVDQLFLAPERPVTVPIAGGPVRVTNRDDGRRRRVTVLFRLILAIPHLLWLSLWSFVMMLLLPVLWIATLVRRRPPEGLHEVYALFVRYALHVYAYLCLAVERFPGFLGRPGSAAVDVDIPPPADQRRLGVAFRLVLALPPLVLASSLVGAGFSGGTSSDPTDVENFAFSFGIAMTAASLLWFAALATGRAPQGLRDLVVWALGYAAQTYAYLFLLTGRYPNSDPAVAPLAPVPASHPLRLDLRDELRRSRLTVAFRLPLAMPHVVWYSLWSVLVVVLALPAWLFALAAGRLPRPLHALFARWVRYGAHVWAFTYLGGGPFPGFAGQAGSYPTDVTVPAAPERQRRWRIALRLVLALPALLVLTAVSGIALIAAVGGWFAALATGRMPEGLRNVVAYGARYNAQVTAYAVLVTGAYPYSGPGDLR
jgi:hypothetical protein